eukprot:TRINITY_DN9780_c0_g1_i1.p1 TRINITY_DN9780_c0_g1~~TRINITY_DN9780_c0_g1_i1.p1  ORF type:complete len:324 (-),score=50.27 TRINITY_DN9780_c0_g1_i1:304-1188(-)
MKSIIRTFRAASAECKRRVSAVAHSASPAISRADRIAAVKHLCPTLSDSLASFASESRLDLTRAPFAKLAWACAKAEQVQLGRELLNIVQHQRVHPAVSSPLIHLLARHGALQQALGEYKRLRKSTAAVDVTVLASLAVGCASANNLAEAKFVWQEMRGQPLSSSVLNPLITVARAFDDYVLAREVFAALESSGSDVLDRVNFRPLVQTLCALHDFETALRAVHLAVLVLATWINGQLPAFCSKLVQLLSTVAMLRELLWRPVLDKTDLSCCRMPTIPACVCRLSQARPRCRFC